MFRCEIITQFVISFGHFSIFLPQFSQVQYQSDQFLDKNKDYVVPEHQDLLAASKCSFVQGLFPPVPEETNKSSNKSSKFSSIGTRFKVYFTLMVVVSTLVKAELPILEKIMHHCIEESETNTNL